MQCQWNQGSFLGQLPWRHWRERPEQSRPGRSYLGSTGAYPLLAGLGAPWLSPSGALSLSTLVAYGGLNGLFNSPPRGFGPPTSHPPGSHVPHGLTSAPPEPQEAEGAGARPLRGRSSAAFPSSSSVTGLPVLQTLGWFPP